MYCTKCGQQNADTSNFCLACGNVLETEAYRQSLSRQTNPHPPANNYYAPVYAPKQKRQYAAEYNLGLVGSIIASVLFLVIFLTCIIELSGGLTASSYYSYHVNGLYLLNTIFWLTSFILGYIGIAKINKLNLEGGLFLITAGVLGLICMFLVPFGLLAVLYWPLLFSGGVTALVRKNRLENRVKK